MSRNKRMTKRLAILGAQRDANLIIALRSPPGYWNQKEADSICSAASYHAFLVARWVTK